MPQKAQTTKDTAFDWCYESIIKPKENMYVYVAQTKDKKASGDYITGIISSFTDTTITVNIHGNNIPFPYSCVYVKSDRGQIAVKNQKMEPYKCVVCDEMVTDKTRCHDCGQGLIGEREQIQQHEWVKTEIVYQDRCTHCYLHKFTSAATSFYLDLYGKKTEEEPACITRPAKEAEI